MVTCLDDGGDERDGRPAAARPVGPLLRVLRGLAADQVLDELPDGRFGLTATGAWLRSDVPGSMRDLALIRGELHFEAAAGLPAGFAVTAVHRTASPVGLGLVEARG